MSGPPRWRLGEPAQRADPPLPVEVYAASEWVPGVLTMRRRDRDGAWWCYVGWRDANGAEHAGWRPYAAALVRPRTDVPDDE